MTHIKKAIHDLRDAINGGEGWPTIYRAYDALDAAIATLPIQSCMNKLDYDLTLTSADKWDEVDQDITALERAIDDDEVDKRVIHHNTILVHSRNGRAVFFRIESENLATPRFVELDERGMPIPTPDLTARIEAAAEEIAKEIKLAWGIECDERDKSDIAAIIRWHLEVK